MATVRRRWNVGAEAFARFATSTGALVGFGAVGRFLAVATAFTRPVRRTPLQGRSVAFSATSCPADWRRPGAYWACSRPAGHTGQHRMRDCAQA